MTKPLFDEISAADLERIVCYLPPCYGIVSEGELIWLYPGDVGYELAKAIFEARLSR